LLESRSNDSTYVRICESAVKIFSSKGYHKTTMDDIASTAGLTKGAIYWHFKNKRELFKFLIERMFSELDHLIFSSLSSASPPPAKILYTFEICVDFYVSNRDFCALMKVFHSEGATLLDNEFETRLRSIYSRYRSLLADIFRQGIAEGYFNHGTDPLIAGSIIIAAFEGISFQWMMDPNAFDLKQVLPLIKKIIENGF